MALGGQASLSSQQSGGSAPTLGPSSLGRFDRIPVRLKQLSSLLDQLFVPALHKPNRGPVIPNP